MWPLRYIPQRSIRVRRQLRDTGCFRGWENGSFCSPALDRHSVFPPARGRRGLDRSSRQPLGAVVQRMPNNPVAVAARRDSGELPPRVVVPLAIKGARVSQFDPQLRSPFLIPRACLVNVVQRLNLVRRPGTARPTPPVPKMSSLGIRSVDAGRLICQCSSVLWSIGFAFK
mgnify:CR=1 FL=1